MLLSSFFVSVIGMEVVFMGLGGCQCGSSLDTRVDRPFNQECVFH